LGLELLSLLLKEVDSIAEAHHVGSHHVRKHIGEAERRHLVVVTTRRSAKLLQTGELSLGLSKILCEVVGV